MMYNSTIRFNTEHPDRLLKALEAELKDEKKQDRSSFRVEKKGKEVCFEIEASDATALRATFNSITQLLAVYEKAEKLVKSR